MTFKLFKYTVGISIPKHLGKFKVITLSTYPWKSYSIWMGLLHITIAFKKG